MPRGGIVEAQQQMKQRALAGAGRADDRDLLAGLDRQRDAVDRRHIRPRRIGEADIVEADIAARRRGSATRRWPAPRSADLTRRISNSRSAAPEAAETSPQTSLSWPSAGRGERRVEHELAEPARRDRAGQHVVRTDPQDHHHAGEDDEDDDRGQHGARAGRIARRLIGLLDLAAETRIGQPLAGIGLHGPDRADQFGGIGGGVGQRILRAARQPPHPAAERHQRNHDHRDRQQHEAGQPRARDHHHGGGADEQHQIAQRDRDRGADRGLDLRGIRGQPRHQFAAARGIEERRRQRDQMREHVAPRSATMRSPMVMTR